MTSPRLYLSTNNSKCYTDTCDEDHHQHKLYFVLCGSMKLILIISLILSGIIQYPLEVIAQTKKTTTTEQRAQAGKRRTPPQKPRSGGPIFAPPKRPSGLTPISGRRAGMGSRGNCPAVKTALTALVPFEPQKNARRNTVQSGIGTVGGLTTSERPKFWFYVPYTQQNLNQSNAEFILKDSNKKNVYEQKQVALPSKPGVISITLPNSVKPLEVGENYHWYFKVRCDERTTSVPIFVEGEIQRIPLNSEVAEQLKAANDPKEKIKIYAKENLWFDALNMLAQKRQSSSQNVSIQKEWQTLLQNIKLGDDIATAPLVK